MSETDNDAVFDAVAAADFTGLAVATLAKIALRWWRAAVHQGWQKNSVSPCGPLPLARRTSRCQHFRSRASPSTPSNRRLWRLEEGAVVKGSSRYIPDWCGPGTGFTITDAVTFLDTVTLYGWRPLPQGVFGALRQQYGRRLIYKRHKLRGRPQACSWHLTLHQPSRATLMDLMAIQLRRFVVHAVEIPTDFITPDRQQADLATAFLTRGLVQKWRRRDHRSQPYLNSLYWKRDRKAARNIGLYGDRQSKTGLGSCSHLELRFTGSKACKRAGLGDLRDLIRGVDPIELLNRQAQIIFIDPKRLDFAVDRIARANLRLDQRRNLQVDRWQRRPNTLSGMQEYVKRWLARCLRDEDLPLDVSTLATARSQNLWDHAPARLRGCLTKRTNWTDFTPTPRWWWW